MTETRPTILFVDDEVPVLDGLRRKLADQNDRWTMLFATGGADALELAARQPVDVVITDMRMPGMDGAALLDEFRRLHPTAARFILSGFSEREAVFRTLGPAHQYFVKPCDSAVLVRAVERTLTFRRRLHAPDMLAVVAGAKAIPTLPKALDHLMEELQSATGAAGQVAKIISSDIGLSAQVLKLVNSAYFFLPNRVTDVLGAVNLLGFDLLRSVAVLAGIFGSFHANEADHKTIERLEHRSLLIGLVARRIAFSEHLETVLINQCQCAGMLAHIGSLLLFAHRSAMMSELQRELDGVGGEILAAEQYRFRTTHPELGACLLNLWGFNHSIVEAVLWHHRPSLADPPCAERIDTVAVVHAAQHLARPEPPEEEARNAWLGKLDLEYLERIRAKERLTGWAEEAARAKRECLS
jgi:HD-like signal output (HDOD) protein/ActR/RegA family two-component response regulator